MEIGDQNARSQEQEDMEINSTKADSIIDNILADMTAAHGSSTTDSSQEPATKGEKEKTTTTINDDTTTITHGRSTTESAQEQEKKEGEYNHSHR